MITYKKTTKDEPVNTRIAYWMKVAKRWVRQIECYENRQLAGENLQKHIDFANARLARVENEIALLRRYAE